MNVEAEVRGAPLVVTAASWVEMIPRLPLYLACTLFALLINYALGKEMAWDLLNYHLYAGFSALHDRFAQDYFAAGPQSYFNPYAYVPFYFLIVSGLPALAVASILAALHSGILWLTFELGLTTSPSATPARRIAIATCAVAMAALNPILLQQIGTSFADITTGELVLGGWLLLATAVHTPSAVRIIGAAALLGAATALKPTNALHALSAVTLLLFVRVPFTSRLRCASIYASAAGLSFSLIAAPWAYRLERVFGNPFFPLLNNVFRAPEFTTESLHHMRFVPSSLSEALWRPFAMLDPWAMVHEEVRAPDSRYALLVVLAAVFLLQRLWRARQPAQTVGSEPSQTADPRVLGALGCAFTVDWVLWLAGSGNSRYFLPLACVAGVLVVALVFKLFSRWPKARNYAIAAIFATQAVQVWMGAELRWSPAPWNGHWFEVTVPEALTKHPTLFFTIEIRSDSFLAPYLPPDAGLISLQSGYPLESTGANGRRVQTLIQLYAPHLRVVLTGARLYPDGAKDSPTVSQVNSALQGFGLQVDPGDCATIGVEGLASDPEIGTGLPVSILLVSCGLVVDHGDHSADLPRQRTANIVLDRLEDACPELFRPRRPPTARFANMWRRIYQNTDLIAWVSKNEVKFFDPARGDDIVYLGSESDWARRPPSLACGRRNDHYFARVLKSPRDGTEP